MVIHQRRELILTKILLSETTAPQTFLAEVVLPFEAEVPFEVVVRTEDEVPRGSQPVQLPATALLPVPRPDKGNNDYAEVSLKQLGHQAIKDPLRNVPKPNIPVGGRLCHFIEEWEGITSDK